LAQSEVGLAQASGLGVIEQMQEEDLSDLQSSRLGVSGGFQRATFCNLILHQCLSTRAKIALSIARARRLKI
jgi:hypothetical protein